MRARDAGRCGRTRARSQTPGGSPSPRGTSAQANCSAAVADAPRRVSEGLEPSLLGVGAQNRAQVATSATSAARPEKALRAVSTVSFFCIT